MAMAQAAASSYRQFVHREEVCEPVEGGKLETQAGDDANRTENDQAAGRAEEPADHRVRHVTDRAAHPRHPEAAQHETGDDG
jgi:hypothetical protein